MRHPLPSVKAGGGNATFATGTGDLLLLLDIPHPRLVVDAQFPVEDSLIAFCFVVLCLPTKPARSEFFSLLFLHSHS